MNLDDVSYILTADEDDEDELEFSDEFFKIRDKSLDFKSNKRLYLGKDINNVSKFIEILSGEYDFILDKSEFGDYSIVPVHKEYDEMTIEVMDIY